MRINFIPDEVLKLTDDTDLLGTKPYSDTIFEIVNNCSGSKNIGLFGSWGSGKSTILTTLENLIDKHNAIKTEKIAYFEFDAWKYSKDDFRRSFLIELTKKFSIKTQSKLEKLLYSESSFEDPKQTKFRINWLSLPDWLILALVVFAFVFFFLPIVGMGDRTKALIALITISVSLLTKAASNTVNKYKVVVKENKLVEPERFEAVFDEIISELTTNSTNKVYHWIQKLIGRTKHSKVVIVIDNLDRCDDQNLLLTLNTVKNFLEHQKVIFILPVDEKGISSFLSQKTDNADEYLRKIFHLILRLKAFSNKELTEFTNSINKKYELGLNSSSIRIICQEFTNNPRKVIQFLNNYQSEMWLIKEQSKKDYINGDFIKENLSFFIKLLIIKYEWKNLYDGILYDKTLLNKINDVITNLKPDDDGLYQIEKTKVRLTDTQRNFLFSTQDIHCTKIDPFVLNIDLDKEIPDDIENYIRLGYYEAIANYLDDSNTPFDEKTLIKKIDEVFSDLTYKHQEYEFIALPVLQLLIEFVLDKKQEKFRKLLIENHSEYPFLKSLFKDARLLNLFEKLDFEKVVDGTKWFFDNISSNLFHSFIGYLKTKYLGSSTMDNENDRINYFIDAFKDTGKLSLIKREFSNKLSGKPEGVSSIESLEDYKIASQLISIPTYKSLAKKLNEKESKGKNLTSILCLDYSVNNKKDKTTREHLLKYYINELENYYTTESISEDEYPEYLEFFLWLNKTVDMKVNTKLSDSNRQVLTELNNHFYVNYTEEFKESEFYEIYEAFLQLIQKIIFNTEDFNLISYRTTFFEKYLKLDFSNKLSLKINDILYKDVNRFNVYNYPFAKTLIEHYENKGKDCLPYGNTLLLMLEKSTENKGLSSTEIDQVILRTINVFARYNSKDSISLMFRLKKSVGEQFSNVLNSIEGAVLDSYVKNVKLLKDKWFYGKSVLNYLKTPFENNNAHDYQTFRGRISVVSKNFSVEEQSQFIQELIDYFEDAQMYKWLRLSFKLVPKEVYDVFIKNLMIAHKNKIVGHNDFFEWIAVIPLKQFSKERKQEYVNYISSSEITHKTYKPKMEKAMIHLK